MGFPRKEYWSGLPFPTPGHLPEPGIKPAYTASQADSIPSEPPEKPHLWYYLKDSTHGNYPSWSLRHNILKAMVPGLPWWSSGYESACQCRGHGSDPWSRRIPHATGQLSPQAATAEAHTPWDLRSTTKEAAAMRSPRTTARGAPTRCSQRKPTATKTQQSKQTNKCK